MKKIQNYVTEAITLPGLYMKSLYKGIQMKELFDNVETYCMFLGYQRSGHSLMGALLNAHSDIVVSHELGVLKYIFARFSKRQIFSLILENSVEFANSGSGSGKRYSYKVPGQWQGRFQRLKIIGDKHGEGATLRFAARPLLIHRLQKTINLDIKAFHIVRNPYDNISTISKRMGIGLEESIAYYFSLCKTIAGIKKRRDHRIDILDFKHEAFIENPKELLKQMCVFLGVDAPNDYLTDCSGIVYKSPHKTRYKAPWNNSLITQVKEKIDQFPFLEGYVYEN